VDVVMKRASDVLKRQTNSFVNRGCGSFFKSYWKTPLLEKCFIEPLSEFNGKFSLLEIILWRISEESSTLEIFLPTENSLSRKSPRPQKYLYISQ